MLQALWHRHRAIRYLVIGGWNTVFGYLAFAGLYLVLHERIHYLVISCVAHFLAVTNAFIWQRWLVFRSASPWWPAYLRFNAVQLVVLGAGLVGMTIMVEVLHLHPLVAQLVVIAGAVVFGYVMNHRYSFRSR